MKLDGKIAVVTGAASGIGKETARALARKGCRLVTVDVDEKGLVSLGEELGDTVALSRRVDVSDADAMRALAADVHRMAPAVDLLVNNAGVGLGGGMLDTPLEDWEWVLRINLWGVIHGCHFFVPPMAERGSGHVVNVSSALGFFATGLTAGYATSKFAVFGLSESLRSRPEASA
jgi:NAD(P)-dependent dehydrogenase (short-subunit alcohol dehydrogenase family)